MIKTLVAILAVLLVAGLVFWFIVVPKSHRKGATDEEVEGPLPGDELVPEPKVGYTQAITISAPPSEVWPWLAQHGYMRAGFYSHEWVYRLMGSNDYYEGDRWSPRRDRDRYIHDERTVRNWHYGPDRTSPETRAHNVRREQPRSDRTREQRPRHAWCTLTNE